MQRCRNVHWVYGVDVLLAIQIPKDHPGVSNPLLWASCRQALSELVQVLKEDWDSF